MIRSIMALAGVAGAIALFVLYTKPAYDGVQALQTENESYDLALEKAAELQRLKQSLLSRYNAFNPSDIDRLHKLLPDHVDNVRLILDLDNLASRHGIALQNVVVSRPTAGENVQGRTVIGPSREQFDSVTLSFATAATYEGFLTFLTDLEDSLRVVDLVDLSIDGGVTSPGAEPIYNFSITLRTYWLK
jgi:hypothetical protein